MPGYATVGIASYSILITLRFLDGICLGGGYTGALPLAMEYSPKNRRGFLGGLILGAFPLAYIVINLLAMASFAIFPLAGPDSPYAVWGWRVPFVIGAVLAFVLVAVLRAQRLRVRDLGGPRHLSSGCPAPRSPVSPARAGAAFLQVFAMMSGFWLTQNMVTLFLPTTVLHTTLTAQQHRADRHADDRLRLPGRELHRFRGARASGSAAARFFLIVGPADRGRRSRS